VRQNSNSIEDWLSAANPGAFCGAEARNALQNPDRPRAGYQFHSHSSAISDFSAQLVHAQVSLDGDFVLRFDVA
jgi:hypothetical protein